MKKEDATLAESKEAAMDLEAPKISASVTDPTNDNRNEVEEEVKGDNNKDDTKISQAATPT